MDSTVQNAYEESLLSGQKTLNQPKPEDPVTVHKRAFRVAYETLTELYPPDETVEYWKFASQRMALKHNENKDNPLCVELLLAVYTFLGKDLKQRRGPIHERNDSNPDNAGMDGR